MNLIYDLPRFMRGELREEFAKLVDDEKRASELRSLGAQDIKASKHPESNLMGESGRIT